MQAADPAVDIIGGETVHHDSTTREHAKLEISQIEAAPGRLAVDCREYNIHENEHRYERAR
ncbi:MAG: hypothetical protein GF353_16110 [Candidatus Lokiarchaeota archaeon]|nr:hypothetical protein [Candidatus Lokiarchaeota archaeon]